MQDGLRPEGVPEEIIDSWRRTREAYRIDPGLSRPLRQISTTALSDRLSDETFRIATPILKEFAARLDISDHVLAYFDGDGWMLSIDGDARTIESVEEIGFRPGVNWAEDAAGTNGPGTALAAGKAVEVFASEHFVEAWHGWSCAGSPVQAPRGKVPAGVVDITGRWEVQRRQALIAAQAIARAIEERLRAAYSVRDEVVRYAFRAAKDSGDALVAVDTRGSVLAVNDAAARHRVVDAGALPPPTRDAVAQLLGASRSGSDADLRIEIPGAAPLVASTVAHDGAVVGAILRAAALRTGRPRPRARGGRSTRYTFESIVGASEALGRATGLARIAARNTLPVLLFGESGTGKELFAHAIHDSSDRNEGPFVAVNCGSIPAQLVEAELFGYEAGTFTGARREGNPGRFEDAHGGTLFLDEVSELPPPAQTALLRVLQEKEVVRLGGSVARGVDVRIVAATNKPLDHEMQARRFRRDLYYRLNVLSIAIPPLRDRREDIAQLAANFLVEAEREVGRRGLAFADDALAALRAHTWPGNVRELKNVILRAVATSPGQVIAGEDLLLEPAAASPSQASGRTQPLEASKLGFERDTLIAAIDACDGNYARVAEHLGISRMTLYRRLQRCGITREPSSH